MSRRKAAWEAALLILVPAALFAGVGTWTTHGPPGGAELVAADPSHPGLVDSGTARSSDGGLTWQPNGLEAYHVHALAVGPTGAVFAAGYRIGPGPDVLLRSRDGGATWSEAYAVPGEILGPILVAAADPATVFVARALSAGFSRLLMFGYLAKSSNGGDRFEDLALPANGVLSAIASDPGNPNALLISQERDPEGIGGFADYRSTDGGATWTRFSDVSFSSIVFDPHQPGTVYFAGSGRLFVSTDGGATLAPVNTTLLGPQSLIVSPTRPDHLYALASGGVFGSVDAGLTWTTLNEGLPDVSAVHVLAIDASGNSLYAATPTGVYLYPLADAVLSLNPGRSFAISLAATDQRTGRAGSGVATQVNDLWGYFSIPAITGNPNNPEVFVKMLDGTALNGSYWLFYGGLTDLEYTLTVTELATGRQRTYTKPAGSECGGSDTAAFSP